MKKLIVSFAAILLALSAWAVPAKPGAFNYTQPDGSVIRLERHGDEFFSWTTLAGTNQVVEQDAQGFWRKSSISPAQREAARIRRAQVNSQRVAMSRRTHTDDPMTHGERHIPVILARFSDLDYSLDNPQDRFNALLNQQGYSDNGATGSVQDFYVDNSNGAFRPVFDVYGPVTLPHEMAYYGQPVKDKNGKIIENDKQPELAIYDACVLLDDMVDFSQYDYDGDGYVDMILFYYPGYNTAEGGSNDAIWPHQWSVQGSSSSQARNAFFDGLKLNSYFCTSELKGRQGVNMCGIGTTCHEFGHSLGLPDFYDTNYEEDGTSHDLFAFSTMGSGSYNNDSRTPPYFNSEERIYLGWMVESDLIPLPQGAVSFGSVKNDIGYISATDTDGEYFLYECRDGSGWDKPLPQGMLVYHVDKSTVRTVGGHTPYEQWMDWRSFNSINAYGDHPCFYVIPAADQGNLNYNNSDGRAWVFPGSYNVTTFVPIDWEGNNTGASLSNISYADGLVSLTTDYSTEKALQGKVSDSSNKGIAGVKVILSKKSEPANGPRRPRGVRPRATSIETVTDENGNYRFILDDFEETEAHLSLSKQDYQSISQDVSLTKRINVVNFTMLKEGESEVKDFRYYDAGSSLYLGGAADLGNSQMASIRIPASELKYGGVLNSVTFLPYYEADAYYVIVDSGKERLFTAQIDDLTGGLSQLVRINLETADITIPEGEDLYVGYAVKNAEPDYPGFPFVVASGSNTYFSEFNLESSNWAYEEEPGYGLVMTASISLFSEPQEQITSFAQMGFVSIADPGRGVYKADDLFLLKLDLPEGAAEPTSLVWTVDGQHASEAVTLTAGTHKIVAEAVYPDSSTETYELTIEVK